MDPDGSPRLVVQELPLPAVTFWVEGQLPPAKAEATSMLSAKHPHRDRVVALLEAASLAMEGQDMLTGDIDVAVQVWAPAEAQVPDATNLLGGIADTLQRRPTGADTSHLGGLADVACYQDDAQIQGVHYTRRYGSELRYQVALVARIDELEGPPTSRMRVEERPAGASRPLTPEQVVENEERKEMLRQLWEAQANPDNGPVAVGWLWSLARDVIEHEACRPCRGNAAQALEDIGLLDLALDELEVPDPRPGRRDD